MRGPTPPARSACGRALAGSARAELALQLGAAAGDAREHPAELLGRVGVEGVATFGCCFEQTLELARPLQRLRQRAPPSSPIPRAARHLELEAAFGPTLLGGALQQRPLLFQREPRHGSKMADPELGALEELGEAQR